MPESPEYIEGVINLRGKIIPIMNIQKRIGISNEEYNDKWKILILNTGNYLLGVLIEKIVEISGKNFHKKVTKNAWNGTKTTNKINIPIIFR